MKRVLAIVIAALIVLLQPLTVCAEETLPYDSYSYDYWGDVVYAPASYIPDETIFGEELECGAFSSPQDMFIAEDGTIYVADTQNNRIVVFDKNWKLLHSIESFENEGEKDTFRSPSGICYSKNKNLYIADTGNNRIVVLKSDGTLKNIISNPRSEVLEDDFVFSPLRVSVDYADRVYVIGNNVYQGIMAFNEKSDFMGFFGTIDVNISFMQRIWRIFSTKAQRSRQQQFIPTEFTGIDIDEEGFVYATNMESSGGQAVRKLNPKGIDVINTSLNVHSTLGGDVNYFIGGEYSGPSTIVDVAIRENGIYSLLDSNHGRIFTYDSEGNLLYIFGGLGTQEGTFRLPVAIESYGDNVMVLDSERNAVFVFKPSQYGSYVNEAVGLRYDGDESKAVEIWKEVLNLDSNNEMAYVGIGKAYLSEGDNKQAMYYLKMGMNKSYYSIAYKRYRNEILKENLGWILTSILLLIVFYKVGKRIFIKRGKTDFHKKKKDGGMYT